MNIEKYKIKNSINIQKKKYIFLIGLLLIGIIFGIIFSFIISSSDKLIVKGQLNNFFNCISNKNINYKEGIVSSISSNLIYCILSWLLGISIIGFPIVLFLLFTKGFITGFSLGSIISIYNFKGVVGGILYIFPHHLINLFLALLLTFYSMNFSFKLISYLFFKKDINFKKVMKRYIYILGICLIVFIISSLLETFLSPILLKLFCNLIK